MQVERQRLIDALTTMEQMGPEEMRGEARQVLDELNGVESEESKIARQKLEDALTTMDIEELVTPRTRTVVAELLYLRDALGLDTKDNFAAMEILRFIREPFPLNVEMGE